MTSPGRELRNPVEADPFDDVDSGSSDSFDDVESESRGLLSPPRTGAGGEDVSAVGALSPPPSVIGRIESSDVGRTTAALQQDNVRNRVGSKNSSVGSRSEMTALIDGGVGRPAGVARRRSTPRRQHLVRKLLWCLLGAMGVVFGISAWLLFNRVSEIYNAGVQKRLDKVFDAQLGLSPMAPVAVSAVAKAAGAGPDSGEHEVEKGFFGGRFMAREAEILPTGWEPPEGDGEMAVLTSSGGSAGANNLAEAVRRVVDSLPKIADPTSLSLREAEERVAQTERTRAVVENQAAFSKNAELVSRNYEKQRLEYLSRVVETEAVKKGLNTKLRREGSWFTDEYAVKAEKRRQLEKHGLPIPQTLLKFGVEADELVSDLHEELESWLWPRWVPDRLRPLPPVVRDRGWREGDHEFASKRKPEVPLKAGVARAAVDSAGFLAPSQELVVVGHQGGVLPHHSLVPSVAQQTGVKAPVDSTPADSGLPPHSRPQDVLYLVRGGPWAGEWGTVSDVEWRRLVETFAQINEYNTDRSKQAPKISRVRAGVSVALGHEDEPGTGLLELDGTGDRRWDGTGDRRWREGDEFASKRKPVVPLKAAGAVLAPSAATEDEPSVSLLESDGTGDRRWRTGLLELDGTGDRRWREGDEFASKRKPVVPLKAGSSSSGRGAATAAEEDEPGLLELDGRGNEDRAGAGRGNGIRSRREALRRKLECYFKVEEEPGDGNESDTLFWLTVPRRSEVPSLLECDYRFGYRYRAPNFLDQNCNRVVPKEDSRVGGGVQTSSWLDPDALFAPDHCGERERFLLHAYTEEEVSAAYPSYRELGARWNRERTGRRDHWTPERFSEPTLLAVDYFERAFAFALGRGRGAQQGAGPHQASARVAAQQSSSSFDYVWTAETDAAWTGPNIVDLVTFYQDDPSDLLSAARHPGVSEQNTTSIQQKSSVAEFPSDLLSGAQPPIQQVASNSSSLFSAFFDDTGTSSSSSSHDTTTGDGLFDAYNHLSPSHFAARRSVLAQTANFYRKIFRDVSKIYLSPTVVSRWSFTFTNELRRMTRDHGEAAALEILTPTVCKNLEAKGVLQCGEVIPDQVGVPFDWHGRTAFDDLEVKKIPGASEEAIAAARAGVAKRYVRPPNGVRPGMESWGSESGRGPGSGSSSAGDGMVLEEAEDLDGSGVLAGLISATQKWLRDAGSAVSAIFAEEGLGWVLGGDGGEGEEGSVRESFEIGQLLHPCVT